MLHIAGDGSFRMNCNELATVARYKLSIITLLFNNQSLGMVRQWQGMFHNGRYSETDIGDEVDYVKLVEAYGLKGIRVDSIEQLEKALLEAIKSKKATIIECILSKDENVFPMVAPGMAINQMIFE